MKSILVLLHCGSNTGFAIGPLESTFFQMALDLCNQDATRVHFGYPSMREGFPRALPSSFRQYLVFDATTRDRDECRRVAQEIRSRSIDTIFGFDLPVSRPIYRHFRRAGVKHMISYWGAPMSSLAGRARLMLKKMEVFLRRQGPDHYIFESHGMAETAVKGRGIPASRTGVVHLGIDLARFSPDPRHADYIHEALRIPRERRIFFYAGHMESRKGVAVIMEAANRLAERRPQGDWHIALFGNRPGEDGPFMDMLTEQASRHVVFGGYRNDLEAIMRGCYAAIIASTGWDSFPRSGLEVQAAGLPLMASSLPGLRESVADGESGFLFPPGDADRLSILMLLLLDQEELRARLSMQARARIERCFSQDVQLANLLATVRSVIER